MFLSTELLVAELAEYLIKMVLHMSDIVFHQESQADRLTVVHDDGSGQFALRRARHHVQEVLIIALP